ncbi:Homeobox-like_domain superfamily [Hexamita inflata]|uniref:Homeobox-like domain superfamily n=1 Tax=Hexamita inflata TaxID=28002 RepID=A0AA86PXA5_9EUKA|nr:Homeobox-like domain superfamily [Hexamita inflata]CAI9948090.1 Homeobox-like domain superfamily [Hexamita inflata]CAI9948096.1 Homeobox-like domain superfamily [Hexamita inflata]CAI9948118.1 Homeobox-like domain superfamily [Hexamita inflata]
MVYLSQNERGDKNFYQFQTNLIEIFNLIWTRFLLIPSFPAAKSSIPNLIMSSKRIYHRWSEDEVKLLYKTVVNSNKNWKQVRLMFPQFSLLQLQNKFTMIEKQYFTLAKTSRNSSDSDIPRMNQSSEETIRVLMELMEQRHE